MSGIGGIVHFDGPKVERRLLSEMAQVIAHRGPDKQMAWQDSRAGLVHAMLETTPESRTDSMPYFDGMDNLAITADCRLDNRAELITIFYGQELRQSVLNDSQLILEAYRKWGKDCPAHLVGDFAFAIWDQTKRQLFCARDHMGIKPFYYCSIGSTLFFCSEISGILRLLPRSPTIDEGRIFDLLIFYSGDRESTFYKEIKRLPARGSMTADASATTIRYYWDFSPDRELRFADEQHYIDGFQEHFERAVSSMLRSNTEVGAFLSGGLDSSSIACVASRLLSDKAAARISTFSQTFGGLPQEQMDKVCERRYMTSAAEHCGLDAHFIKFTNQGPLRDFSKRDDLEPMAYFNGYLLDGSLQAVEERGIRTMLDGTDGDTTISHGYERLYALGRSHRLFALLNQINLLSRREGLPRISPLKVYWQYILRPRIPQPLIDSIHSLPGRRSSDFLAMQKLDPHFRKRFCYTTRRQQAAPAEATIAIGRQRQYHSFVSPGQQYIMELIDTRKASFPVEIRYPFWDRRLMEYTLALPLEQKLDDGWTRVILRKSMQLTLPKTISGRIGKADLSPQFLLDLHRTAEPFISKLLDADSRLLSYVRKDAISQTWQRFRHSPFHEIDAAGDLYLYISLGQWLQSLG